MVSNGGHQLVYALGTASGTVVSAGGTETLYANGLARGTVVSSGGYEIISAGGLASGTIGIELGRQFVSSGGRAISATFSYDGTQYVCSGGTASGTTLSADGVQYVSSGGTASGTMVSSGGTEVVYAGGAAVGTTLANGGTIDAASLAFAKGGLVSLNPATNLLTVIEAGTTYTQVLAGNYAATHFILTKDSTNHTNITAVAATTVSSLATAPAKGALGTGQAVGLTLQFNAPVTVAGGTPALALNDGGTATYTGGSGTSALTFSCTVAAGQRAANLAVTGSNLHGATILDGYAYAADLSGAVGASSALRITGRAQYADFAGNGTSDILLRDPISGKLSDFLMHNGQPTFAYIGFADRSAREWRCGKTPAPRRGMRAPPG